MNERIKLTEDDFESISSHDNTWCFNSEICINTGDEKQDDRYIQQILIDYKIVERISLRVKSEIQNGRKVTNLLKLKEILEMKI